jgi:hypothetical protein
MSKYISVSELPEILQKALKSVGYGRKDIQVDVQEVFCPRPPSGDGMRGFLVAVNLETEEYQTTMGCWGGSNAFNTTIDDAPNSVDVPANIAFVRGSEGGGRPVYATIVVGPTNVNPTLLPTTATVSDREAEILGAFKSFKSAYRKEWLAEHKVTQEEIESLVERQLIKRNKRGAMSITTEGKNQAARVY